MHPLVRRIVGKAIIRAVLVDQRGKAQGLVVLVANPLPFGILAAARQAVGGALQARGLAFAVGVRQHLAEVVAGEAFRRAIRVLDAQYLTVNAKPINNNQAHTKLSKPCPKE